MPGPGPRFTVEALPKLAPTISLLTTVDIVPNLPAANDPTGLRWMNGIQYRSRGCEIGSLSMRPVGCQPDNDPMVQVDKPLLEGSDDVARDPVELVIGDTCSTFGWEENNYVQRARDTLQAIEAYRVEQELWGGAAAQVGIGAGVEYPTDQWLNATGESSLIAAGAVISPMEAMGEIAAQIALCGFGRGVIHVPMSLLAYFLDLNIVKRDGARYLDGVDNLVVFGAGYDGTGPGAASPTAGAQWIYGTGPLRIYRSDAEILPGTFAQAVDRVNNNVTFYAERWYLIDFDPCCHTAAQVAMCDTDICTGDEGGGELPE